MELAFIVALQHLPGSQRAVLILRDVFGFSATEAAEMLATTVASVNGALQRARKAVDQRLPAQSQQATLRSIGDRPLREVVNAYMDAIDRGDVQAVVAMLTEDATLSMPPLPTWYAGHEAIAAFLAREPLSGRYRWRHAPTRANGQAAVAGYILVSEALCPNHGYRWAFAAPIGFAALGLVSAILLLRRRTDASAIEAGTGAAAVEASPSSSG
jgi:RNA polymerase sigma-70 factor (ECF subfamily)